MKESKNLFTCTLSKEQIQKFLFLLKDSGSVVTELIPYALYALRMENTSITLYTSGKLVIQGKGTSEFVETFLIPHIIGENSEESFLIKPDYSPHIGIDESGKGDFFGPLCIAGVYVNRKIIQHWEKSGIQDSKNIKSDKKITELAHLICTTPGVVQNIVTIGNEAYNRLHEKMKSVNRILAWGHARIIENLLIHSYQMNPLPEKAISDQFSNTKSTIEKTLMSLGKNLLLEQMHKAEADIAVAAASILARNEFVKRLTQMCTQYGITFPRGSTSVIDTGKKFVNRYGKEFLPKVAKMHFRTSFTILGLPTPPKTTWSTNSK